MTDIAVVGAGGRMGQTILGLIGAAPGDWKLVGAVDQGKVGLPVTLASAEDALGLSKEEAVKAAQVIIDFTGVSSSLETAALCRKHKAALVVGSTGFAPEQRAELLAAGADIPFLWAPNMSVGVNMLFKLAGIAASALGDDYNVEIIESHHNQKVDAPSGTATRLKEVILDSLKRSEADVIYGRQGIIGKRPPREIGVHTLRGGSIVGEHTVLFAGPGENIELKHTALSRDTFAAGALRAARYLVSQNKPGVYTMADVLSL